MKKRIIEICELGQPQSIIHRENEPITELIKTTELLDELNEQLRIGGVSGSLPSDFIKKAMDYSTKDKRFKSGNYMDIYDDDRFLLIKCIYDCWQ